MSQTNQTFKAAELSSQFKQACIAFDTLLASSSSDELKQLRQKFRDSLEQYKEKGCLTVAFIGQYSAGKSTIISALTGRRDIHIDADIATDQTTSYDWNGIKIIDTPGLFTDRTDHDEITYEAIAKADLLIFCLTHTLFDTFTVENFKKLAYDKGYRWKIMLLVNKMSAEAGEEEQKISSYTYSITEALKPYNIKEFPLYFIDAKDYCEGIDEGDEFLSEISRFDSFISGLNDFVHRRASLVNLDTPVRIVLESLDKAQIGFARNSNEDTAFLEVLSRISRRTNKERERLRTKVKGITLEMSSAIITEGENLATAVGEENFEQLNKQSEINVRKHYEKVGEALESIIENALQSLQLEVQSELQSNLTQAFVAQIRFDGNIKSQYSQADNAQQNIFKQVQWLQQIGGNVGAKITTAATREFASTASQGFLRSMDVAGSKLHQGVYSIGKMVGFKFKPFQAVGIAKNIGNAARFLGPALSFLTIVLDAHSIHQETKREKKMADVRRDITSEFSKIAIDLEQQIDGQIREFESQVYGQLDKNISEARHQTELAMTHSSEELKKLAKIRNTLNLILKEVQMIAVKNAF